MRKVVDASDGVWCRWCSLCFLCIYWMLLVWFTCLARNSNVLGLILALLLSYIFSFLIVGIVVYQPKYSAPMHSIVGRWRFESLSIYQWLMVHHIHSLSLSLCVCVCVCVCVRFLPWPLRRLINGHSLCRAFFHGHCAAWSMATTCASATPSLCFPAPSFLFHVFVWYCSLLGKVEEDGGGVDNKILPYCSIDKKE